MTAVVANFSVKGAGQTRMSPRSGEIKTVGSVLIERKVLNEPEV